MLSCIMSIDLLQVINSNIQIRANNIQELFQELRETNVNYYIISGSKDSFIISAHIFILSEIKSIIIIQVNGFLSNLYGPYEFASISRTHLEQLPLSIIFEYFNDNVHFAIIKEFTNIPPLCLYEMNNSDDSDVSDDSDDSDESDDSDDSDDSDVLSDYSDDSDYSYDSYENSEDSENRSTDNEIWCKECDKCVDEEATVKGLMLSH